MVSDAFEYVDSGRNKRKSPAGDVKGPFRSASYCCLASAANVVLVVKVLVKTVVLTVSYVVSFVSSVIMGFELTYIHHDRGEMIMEVVSDGRKVDNSRHVERRQELRIADPRDLQQLRCV
jgi:hypothetical protein